MQRCAAVQGREGAAVCSGVQQRAAVTQRGKPWAAVRATASAGASTKSLSVPLSPMEASAPADGPAALRTPTAALLVPCSTKVAAVTMASIRTPGARARAGARCADRRAVLAFTGTRYERYYVEAFFTRIRRIYSK